MPLFRLITNPKSFLNFFRYKQQAFQAGVYSFKPNIYTMKYTTISAAVVCSFLFPLSAVAQTNCEELKKENEYLKKAMQINTPVSKVTSSKIDFNFVECKGDAKDQTITLVLMLVNHDANREFQFRVADAVDMEGNEYPYGKFSIGGRETSNTIRTEVPIKTTIVFKKVLPGVKMLKSIAISYYDDNPGPGREPEIEFRDVAVKW